MLISFVISGLFLRYVGEWQSLDTAYYKGMTVMKLVMSVGKIAGGTIDPEMMVNPGDRYFDDSLFFEVHGEGEEEDHSEDDGQSKHVYPVLKGERIGGNTAAYNNDGYYHKE